MKKIGYMAFQKVFLEAKRETSKAPIDAEGGCGKRKQALPDRVEPNLLPTARHALGGRRGSVFYRRGKPTQGARTNLGGTGTSRVLGEEERKKFLLFVKVSWVRTNNKTIPPAEE